MFNIMETFMEEKRKVREKIDRKCSRVWSRKMGELKRVGDKILKENREKR